MKVFLSYFPYLKPVLPTFILGLLAGVVFAVSSGFGIPFMMHKVFPVIFAEDAERLSLIAILAWAAFIPGIMLVRGASGYFNAYLINFCGMRILESVRMDLFSKFQALPISYLDRVPTGELISRCQSDTSVVQQSLTTVANDLVKQPLTLIGAIAVLIYLSVQQSEVVFLLVAIAVIPLAVLPITIMGKRILRRSRQTQAQLGSVTGFLSENLRAAREVRAYSQERPQEDRFRNMIRHLLTVQMKAIKYKKGLPPIVEVISSIGVGVAFVYAYRAGISLELFIPIIGALYLSYQPLKKIGAAWSHWQTGRGAMERLNEVLREPVTLQDPPEPRPVDRLSGHIRFRDVSFSYGSGPVLSHIDVEIPAGKVFALVGPSGAGKTTFANLIPRFYDVNEGSVLIDDIDVRDMRQDDLRRNIALVSQHPFLFNDTAANNICIGRPNATRDEIIAAAKSAHADEFLSALPSGYDTVIGEDAFSLSGGQRQRLALARAFLKNAPLLILDEATSALDSESESKIKEALAQLMQGKTVIMIAHRFSTILHADCILLFESGRITASGAHEDLYQSNEMYRGLYDKQTVQLV